MAAAYTDLYIEQGTTFSTSITLDDVYGQNFDLTNFYASSQLRKSYYSPHASAVLHTSIDPLTSVVTLSLSSANSALILPGIYVYDAVIIDSADNNNTIRILEGRAIVAPSVTR